MSLQSQQATLLRFFKTHQTSGFDAFGLRFQSTSSLQAIHQFYSSIDGALSTYTKNPAIQTLKEKIQKSKKQEMPKNTKIKNYQKDRPADHYSQAHHHNLNKEKAAFKIKQQFLMQAASQQKNMILVPPSPPQHSKQPQVIVPAQKMHYSVADHILDQQHKTPPYAKNASVNAAMHKHTPKQCIDKSPDVEPPSSHKKP